MQRPPSDVDRSCHCQSLAHITGRHRCHICTGTRPHPRHICTGTWFGPATSAPGLRSGHSTRRSIGSRTAPRKSESHGSAPFRTLRCLKPSVRRPLVRPMPGGTARSVRLRLVRLCGLARCEAGHVEINVRRSHLLEDSFAQFREYFGRPYALTHSVAVRPRTDLMCSCAARAPLLHAALSALRHVCSAVPAAYAQAVLPTAQHVPLWRAARHITPSAVPRSERKLKPSEMHHIFRFQFTGEPAQARMSSLPALEVM